MCEMRMKAIYCDGNWLNGNVEMKVNVNNNLPSEIWHISPGERWKSITNQRTHKLIVRLRSCSVLWLKRNFRTKRNQRNPKAMQPICQKSFDEKISNTKWMQIYANELHSIFDALTSGTSMFESCEFSTQNAYTYEYSLFMWLGAENRKNKYYFLVRPVVVGASSA